MSTLKQIAWICTAAAAAAVLSAFLHPKRPPWSTAPGPEDLRWRISPAQAAELAASAPVLWVDSRRREHYEAGRMEGALLLNTEEWGDLMFENLDALQSAMGRPVVVYCDTATCGRSDDIARRLRELVGLEPVFVLEGDWREIPGLPSPPGVAEP